MIGLKKSANARLAIRIFGKVRSFLKRAMIPRTTPLPSTANTAKMGIKTNAQIVMNKESSTSMIFLARPRVKTKNKECFQRATPHWGIRYSSWLWRQSPLELSGKHRQSCFAYSPYGDHDKFYTFSVVPKKIHSFEVSSSRIFDPHCRIYNVNKPCTVPIDEFQPYSNYSSVFYF